MSKAKPLRVAFPQEHEYARASSVEAAYKGFMQEMLSKIAALLSHPLEFTIVVRDSLKQKLLNKETDIVVLDPSFGEFLDEAITIIPCNTTVLTTFALLVWDKVPVHVSSLHDLCFYPNNKTAVTKGSVEEEYLRNYPDIPVREVSEESEIFVELKLGMIRFGLVKIDQAQRLVNSNPNLKMIPISLNKQFLTHDEKLAVRAEDTQLISDIRKSLDMLRENRTLSKLHFEWFNNIL